MGGGHLITDEETRKITEGFLETSPWLGDAEWERIVTGPRADYYRDFEGRFPPDVELSDGHEWSWSVSFTDPAGRRESLTHAKVLEGLNRIVYEPHQGTAALQFMRIDQWFREPTQIRQQLELSSAEHSSICQYALYAKTVFPVAEDFGKFDLFEDQRSGGEAPTP
ncbi:hypothetical protein ACIO3R_38390 [Streptomyces sp. NPDC087428]|uniref:hypothetical protein n=1 Tax=Streptomyces sp. NPDC087428 TaxID=3365788 RepID=UPI00382966E8